MSQIPEGPNLQYARGDTESFQLHFTVTDENNVTTNRNLTGATDIELTVNSDLNPTDIANEVAIFAGTLTGTPIDGLINFAPVDQATSDAYVPGFYFYDVQVTLTGKVTLCKSQGGEGVGQFEILQDIGKN